MLAITKSRDARPTASHVVAAVAACLSAALVHAQEDGAPLPVDDAESSSQFSGRIVALETFLGVATAAQQPHSTTTPGEPKYPVRFSISDFDEHARLLLGIRSLAHIESFSLRCGIAGTEGPAIWARDSAPVPNEFGGHPNRILGSELITNADSDACGGGEANIAALRALAEERRLYLQLDAPDGPIRAQLWPRPLQIRDSGLTSQALASDSQVVGAQGASQSQRARASLTFTETAYSLATAGYVVPDRQRFRSVSLLCAPPGQTGEFVASLPLGRGVLTNADISPTSGAGACGVAINNVASMLEALLQGNLYAEFVDVARSPRVLRGQFSRP